MAKQFFIHQNKRYASTKPRYHQVLYASLAIFAIVILLIVYQVYKVSHLTLLTKNFNDYVQNGEFQKAEAYFSDLQNKAALNADDYNSQNSYQEALTILAAKTDTVLAKLQTGESLDPGEIEFLNIFAKETHEKVKNYMTSICNDILTEQIDLTKGQKILESLSQAQLLKAEAKDFLKILPQLANFTKSYKEALNSGNLDQEVRLLKQMRDYAPKDLPALYTLFDQQYTEAVTKLRKVTYDAMAKAVAGKQYYSLAADLERTKPYLGQENEWLKYNAQLQKVNLPELVAYEGPITCLKIRPLVRFPEIAMVSGLRKFYMQKTFPANSIRALLASLQANNYILTNPLDFINSDGMYEGIRLPANKRPIILVIEGLNYDLNRMQTGSFNKLVYRDGNMLSVANNGSKEVIEPDVEATGIINEFVLNNPEFSFNGARAVIALEGRKSTFGYLTTAKQVRAFNAQLATSNQTMLDFGASELKQQVLEAKKVADYLKDNGFVFANMGYDINDFANLSSFELEQDLKFWQETMEPIIGKDIIYCFPNGSGLGLEDVKLSILYKAGYRAYLQTAEQFSYGNPKTPFMLNMFDVNPLAAFFKRHEAIYNSNAIYRGIIEAKMYDPPRTAPKKKP